MLDKLIIFLLLALLVSVICAVLLRFATLHWSLKAIINLVITTAVVCAVVMQDGSAPPLQFALMITLFQRTGLAVRGPAERGAEMAHQQTPRPRAQALGADCR